MNEEMTGKCLQQVEHIRGLVWHRYSITVNQVMVATVKLSNNCVVTLFVLFYCTMCMNNLWVTRWVSKRSMNCLPLKCLYQAGKHAIMYLFVGGIFFYDFLIQQLFIF